MSSLLHPTGSEPPQVYWRRRLVVVVVFAVVLAGVIWLLWPKGTPQAQPQLTPLTPPASTSAAVPPPVPSSANPSAPATPTGPQVCDPANLRVGLAGFEKLKSGAAQPFKISITNSTAIGCVLSASASTISVVVTSGNDRIWTTADCAAWVPTKRLTLTPAQPYVFDVNWPGKRSKASCKTTKDAVAAGTYVGTATFVGAAPARLVMTISAT
jgi:hypothetical protein